MVFNLNKLFVLNFIFKKKKSLYSGMFPMPRIVYAISSDGLIFKFFSTIIPKFKTPIAATIVTGLFTGFFF